VAMPMPIVSRCPPLALEVATSVRTRSSTPGGS